MEEAIRSVNGLLARGMDWGDIARIVDAERERGNVVAEIILQLKLKEGRMVVGLREEQEGDETDDESEGDMEDSGDSSDSGDGGDSGDRGGMSGEVVRIEIDLALSAWANAREYFDKKKVAAEKVPLPPANIPSQLSFEGGD